VGTIPGQVSDLEIQEAEISRLRRVLESMFASPGRPRRGSAGPPAVR
jgi:hypothetical protein